MILAFLCGFITAILALIVGVVMAFQALNQHVSNSVTQAAVRRAEVRREIDAAATLDPVKIISKVQFGTFDAVEKVPETLSADEKLARNYERAHGRTVRYGRITLVGAVISVYETVVVDRNGNHKPIKEKIRRGNGKGGDAAGGGASNTINGVVSILTGDIRAGEPASERLVGKIPISRLSVRVESLSEEKHLSGTASVHTRYLVLQKEGDDVPNQVYTLPANVDEKELADKGGIIDEATARKTVTLKSPQLFLPNGARPDTKRGVIVGADGKEIATFNHHEDTPIRWRTIMIRFSTVRELERWYDVLRPTIVTNQWKVFLKSLPQVDVLNVLMARIFFENRELRELNDIVAQKINKVLSNANFPPQMSKSRVVAREVNVGGEIPIVSNVSPLATSACGEIAFDLDLWYRGGFTCKLLIDLALTSDKLLKLDFKAPQVEATVHFKELKGRMHLSIGAPPSHRMWLGFHELPEVVVELNLDLVKTEETGTLAKLVMQAIPDLSEVLTNVVREKLFEDMTLPHLDDFPVPNVEDTPPSTPIVAPSSASSAFPLTGGGNNATTSSSSNTAAGGLRQQHPIVHPIGATPTSTGQSLTMSRPSTHAASAGHPISSSSGGGRRAHSSAAGDQQQYAQRDDGFVHVSAADAQYDANGVRRRR